MTDPVAVRAAALVADDGHRRLLGRLRGRLERGGRLETVLLRGLDDTERRALADLLGRADRVGVDVRVSIAEVDAALRSSRVGAGLVEVLEALGGPLHDHRATRRAQERAWDELFAELAGAPQAPSWRRDWVVGLRRGTLKRLAEDVADARTLATAALSVLAQLPCDGVQLADLAATATGDPHALDHGRGRALPVLVLGAVAAQQGLAPDQPSDARDRRALWAAVGVQCDPLSVTTLVHGLRVEPDGSLLATTLRAHAEAGEPVRLTLRQLEGAGLVLAGGVLHVCENPSLVASAADVLGADCAPLLCVEGIPSTATYALLDALGPVELRNHADFDAGGIRIANLLHRRDDVVPWRFCAEDYLAALDAAEQTIPITSPIEDASWDAELSEAMRARGRAVHEEQVLDVLLADLRVHGTQQPAAAGRRLRPRTTV